MVGLKKGAARFDLRDPYGIALGLSWGRFALAFALLELSINALFGTLYWLQPGCVANLPGGSFLYAFFFSVETLATVGYGVMAPATLYGHVVSSVEILSGIAFTAIMTGLTFVRFSRPQPRIVYAEHPVVARYNGAPTLMLRLANGRNGMMTDAQARLSVLLPEVTAEGRAMRRTHDLVLVRNHSPIFALTWTLMHRIEPGTPLHGWDGAELAEKRVRLFLSVAARDVTLGVTVNDLHDYGAAQIRFGMRYVDAISFDPEGRPVADLTAISAIEPDIDDAAPDGPDVEEPPE